MENNSVSLMEKGSDLFVGGIFLLFFLTFRFHFLPLSLCNIGIMVVVVMLVIMTILNICRGLVFLVFLY